MEPPAKDAQRCIEIRCKSKRGESYLREDSDFCRKMYKKYPEWYKKTEAMIFNLTVPFGSFAHRDE